MRCLAGIVLFIVLYFTCCKILGDAGGVLARRDNPGISQKGFQAARVEAQRKYHALVGVAVGLFSIAACSLPGYLVRASARAELRQYAEEYERC